MLPRHYRFTALNSLGQTIAAGGLVVAVRRKKFDASGALDYEAAASEVLNNAAGVGTGAYEAGTAQNNDADAWLGLDGILEVTAPASSSGNVVLYLDRSPDGVDWPDNGLGEPVAVLNFTAAGTKRVAFEI